MLQEGSKGLTSASDVMPSIFSAFFLKRHTTKDDNSFFGRCYIMLRCSTGAFIYADEDYILNEFGGNQKK